MQYAVMLPGWDALLARKHVVRLGRANYLPIAKRSGFMCISGGSLHKSTGSSLCSLESNTQSHKLKHYDDGLKTKSSLLIPRRLQAAE